MWILFLRLIAIRPISLMTLDPPKEIRRLTLSATQFRDSWLDASFKAFVGFRVFAFHKTESAGA